MHKLNPFYMNKKIILFFLLLIPAMLVRAQLTFPKGTVLHLNTNKAFLYPETGIYFNTGINKVTDYRWYKMPEDSLDARWDFQACMNGDCKIGLPAEGDFITDFGLNDTTGFIMFHVNTGGFSGKSKLSYRVAHKSDTADQAVMEYNITYTNTTGISDQHATSFFNVYPNPAIEKLYIVLSEQVTGTYSLFSSDGRLITSATLSEAPVHILVTSSLEAGIYFLQIQSDHFVENKRIIIAH